MDAPERSSWIADRLSRARADAERIARDLLRDGRLTTDEVTALAAAVDEAIERGRVLIAEALREPRRILAGLRQGTERRADHADGVAVPPAEEDAAARIARLEARIAALEALVAGDATRATRPHPGGEGDGI